MVNFELQGFLIDRICTPVSNTPMKFQNNLDRIFSESSESAQQAAEYAKAYSAYLGTLLSRLDFNSIGQFAEVLYQTRENGKRIYLIGNGGSAATASHFANDLQIGVTPFTRSSFQAVSLTDNSAIMSCIGNDFGYDEVFRRQLEVLMQPGDIVIAISASGNSPNIINAVDFCLERGNFVIGLTGFDGGKLKQKSNLNINIETPHGEYGPVEDLHMVLDHLTTTYLIRKIRNKL